MGSIRCWLWNIVFKYGIAQTGCHQECAVEHCWVCTIDGNRVTNQQTVVIGASNSCSLVIETTRDNTSNLNQFLNVVQPRCDSLIVTCRTKRRNIQFVTRQIVRTCVRKNRRLSVCNTQNAQFQFICRTPIDINKDIGVNLRASIPIFYNTVLRTSTFNELVECFFLILNNFFIIDTDCSVSFWPTNRRVNRNNTFCSVKCLNQSRLIRNRELTLQSFFRNCEFIYGAYTSIDRNHVFNQCRCRANSRINRISVLEQL